MKNPSLKKQFIDTAKILILSAAIIAGTSTLFADWTAPLANAPTCTSGSPGCDAPINIGPLGQAKNSGLALGTTSTSSLISATNPSGSILDAEGVISSQGLFTYALTIPTNAATGDVLTSDSSGTATWQAPTSGGGGLSTYLLSNDVLLVTIPATTLNKGWTTIDLSSVGVPSNATAVMLKGYISCSDGGSECGGNINARATGTSVSPASGLKIVVSEHYASSYDSGGNSAVSDSAIVPIGANDSIDYELTGSGTSGGASLYATGYMVGSSVVSTPTGPATGATCLLSSAQVADNQAFTLNIQGQGGTGVYSYEYYKPTSISSTPGTSYTKMVAATSVNDAGATTTPGITLLPGTYSNIYVGAEAFGSNPTDTFHTASCPSILVTYPQVAQGGLKCATSDTISGSNQTLIYTLSGTPTGGSGTYEYQFATDGDGFLPNNAQLSSTVKPLESTNFATVGLFYPSSPGTVREAEIVYPYSKGDGAGADISVIISSSLYASVNGVSDEANSVTVPDLCGGPNN